MLLGMVKEDMASGVLKDWGAFPGDRSGFGVVVGSEMDVMKLTMRYAPHIMFRVKPVVSADELLAFLKSVAG